MSDDLQAEARRLLAFVPREVLYSLSLLAEREKFVAFLTHNSPASILDAADTPHEEGAAVLALLLAYPGVRE